MVKSAKIGYLKYYCGYSRPVRVGLGLSVLVLPRKQTSAERVVPRAAESLHWACGTTIEILTGSTNTLNYCRVGSCSVEDLQQTVMRR